MSAQYTKSVMYLVREFVFCVCILSARTLCAHICSRTKTTSGTCIVRKESAHACMMSAEIIFTCRIPNPKIPRAWCGGAPHGGRKARRSRRGEAKRVSHEGTTAQCAKIWTTAIRCAKNTTIRLYCPPEHRRQSVLDVSSKVSTNKVSSISNRGQQRAVDDWLTNNSSSRSRSFFLSHRWPVERHLLRTYGVENRSRSWDDLRGERSV